MSETYILNRTLAISAIYAVAQHIKQIAWHGLGDDDNLVELLAPILRKEDAIDGPNGIYTDLYSMHNGIKGFRDSLEGTAQGDREVNRYVFSLIYLAKKLNDNPNMLSYIGGELDHIRKLTGFELEQTEDDNFYALSDEHVLRQFASIYQNSISKLGPRILISGQSEFLAQDKVAETIRALLLSGIRSAILWYRNGGSRLKILFGRKKYIECTRELLKPKV